MQPAMCIYPPNCPSLLHRLAFLCVLTVFPPADLPPALYLCHCVLCPLPAPLPPCLPLTCPTACSASCLPPCLPLVCAAACSAPCLSSCPPVCPSPAPQPAQPLVWSLQRAAESLGQGIGLHLDSSSFLKGNEEANMLDSWSANVS